MEITENGQTAIDIPEDFDSDAQVLRWLKKQRTPLEYVERREGRAGDWYYYVRHQYVSEILNRICRYDWDFEVLSDRKAEDHIAVLGKLTVRVAGCTIVKSQWGGSTIDRYSGGKNKGKMLSLGDAYKGATSDALKKSASLIGIGGDLSLPMQDGSRAALNARGSEIYGQAWNDARHDFVRTFTGGRTQSSKELLDIEARLLTAVLNKNIASDLVAEVANPLRDTAKRIHKRLNS